jgi:hypothetical protein
MTGSTMSPPYSSLLFFLFIGHIGLFRLCRNSFRLNDGFETGFRCDHRLSMGSIRILCSFSFSFSSACSFSASISSTTAWRLGSRLSSEYIRHLCSLSVCFSLSVLSVSSDYVVFASLSLPTEWRLRSRHPMECIRFRKREVRETELAFLAETRND